MKDNFCYIHIPFCKKRCKYCSFTSFWNLDIKNIDKYVDLLNNEINNSSFVLLKEELKSIYLWGWTPSILSSKQLELLINSLKNKYKFNEKIEITIETTPSMISIENLIWWKNIWINRISIWVQTLNKKSLEEIWRLDKGDIIDSLDILKNFLSFDSISLDFIIWLPHIKKWEIKNNIEYILNNFSFINHISIYMLENDRKIDLINSYWNNKYIKYILKWKGLSIKEKDYLYEYLEIKNFLKSKWFYSYEISNFSKFWFESKHNMWYWNHSNIIPFWLWAHWYINNVRFNNSYELKKYELWIKENYEMIEDSDLFLEKIMFWLRTSWIKYEYICELNIEKIKFFIEEWLLIQYDDETIKITDKWIIFMDYILSEII